MTYRSHIFSALITGTALLTTACSVAPPMNEQETQIKTDLAVDNFLPATRQMRDAIETQELFAQAAFWSNEYNLNPSDLESALKLSAAVRKLGNPGRAVEITQTTRALYPRDPYLLAEYGAALIATERSLDAVPILDQGLAVAPNYGRLWSLKGAALDQQERYAEARKHYDRALRITPNDPNVMANLGLSYALAGDPGSAEGWLRRAASMPNASDSVRQNLMLVLQLQGKTTEAEKLAGLARPQMSFPSVRPAFNPAAPTPQKFTPPAQHQAFNSGSAPKARLHTGPAQGQNFKSASEAARAMAAKRPGQSAMPLSPKGYVAPQQAAAQATPQQYVPQGYPQPSYSQGYPQQGQPQAQAGAPTDRRAPTRRRR